MSDMKWKYQGVNTVHRPSDPSSLFLEKPCSNSYYAKSNQNLEHSERFGENANYFLFC